MAGSYYFEEHYEEHATLNDGTPIRLRLIRPSDKDLLVRGFARLSPESRYRRFFSVKTALSPAELRYLTEPDGLNHFAIGASTQEPTGAEEGLGIARFVRLKKDPHAAEAAIAVIDAMQGKSLGRLLLMRLVAAALERGIQRFCCDVLIPNEPVRALLRDWSSEASVQIDGNTMRIEVPLPPLPPDDPLHATPRQTALYRLFTLAAKQAIFPHPTRSQPENGPNTNPPVQSD